MHYDDPLPEPEHAGYHWARNRFGGSYEMVRVEHGLATVWVESAQHKNKKLRDSGLVPAVMLNCPVEQYYDFVPLPVPA